MRTTLYSALTSLLLITPFFALVGPFAQAQVPHLISHQGILQDAVGNPLSGPHTLSFQIFDAVQGGTALFTEEHPDWRSPTAFSM